MNITCVKLVKLYFSYDFDGVNKQICLLLVFNVK